MDINLVTVEAEPQAVDVLAEAPGAQRQPLAINGIKADPIATARSRQRDLDGLNDRDRLFVTARRWAFESGRPPVWPPQRLNRSR